MKQKIKTKIRIIQNKEKKYLILKFLCEEYIIIDIEKNENISKIDFQTCFNTSFFIQHFDEEIKEDEKDFSHAFGSGDGHGDEPDRVGN